jgi:Methyltransferase domain
VLSEDDIADYFWTRSLGGQDRADYSFHRRRWAFLLTQVERLVELRRGVAGEESLRILDIGVSLQTDLLRHNYPDIPVDTLDIVESVKDLRPGERHVTFDLNDLYGGTENWPQIGPYDVIVMAEVIEHLYTAGRIALSFLAEIMRPGAFVFLQTPNAVALHKRLRMLSGRNPYMSLDGDRLAPGHFHEYTVTELSETALQAGLEVFEISLHNYFTASRPLAAIYNRVCGKLPGTFRAGISMTLRKPES